MPIPEPFTPAALSAGVVTNIASDILKHHAQALEGTLAGRMLKSAGLIEPDFDDRLCDTLSKALNLYFETYPQYQLTGVTAFFRDPAVARQIGGYILDRKPIDQEQIQHALDRHLHRDGTTRVLMKQRGLELDRIVPDFLECYRRVLNEQLSVPQMAILLEIVDQTDTVIAEMRASEGRLKAYIAQLLEGKLSSEARRPAYQTGQQELATDLIEEEEPILTHTLKNQRPHVLVIGHVRPRAWQSLGLAEVRGAIEVTAPAFWKSYLHAVSEAYQNWHIPDELRHLIDWQVDPVPIDDYLILRSMPGILSSIRTSGSSTSPNTYDQELLQMEKQSAVTGESPKILSQVVDQGASTTALIAGSSGAGKSTLLKYLCSQTTVNTLAALERDKDPSNLGSLEIPIYVPLRQYGPTRLMELISAQFHRYSLAITNNQLDDALEQVPFVFLFDGLDEVKLNWRQEAINELEVFRQRYPQHRIIATTRVQPQPAVIQGFEIYEIGPLTDAAVAAFAEHYLGGSEKFTRQIKQRGLMDLVRVPLLLTLALVIFKRKSIAFDSLVDVYQEIVLLYKIAWEERKKAHRLKHSLPWDIIEEALSELAYRMVSDGGRYAISSGEALDVFKLSARRFSDEFRWPGGYTVDDLLNQLLAHNFLELLEGEVSFWHASFRDYFATLTVIDLPEEEIVKHAESREWAGVTAFVGGLVQNPQPVRDALVRRALDDIDDSAWPVYTLSLMGSDTTSDIIQACSVPTNIRTQFLAERILADRGFEGVGIFRDTREMLEYPPIEEPDWDSIGFEKICKMYENVMLALSAGDIGRARQRHDELYRYLESFNPQPQEVIEPWLSSNGIRDLYDFRQKLIANQLSEAALLAFCRNTTSWASLPYLEEIFLLTEDSELRREAHLGVQCVLHTWQ
jgi:hypothetical protein